jgi:hypothetical protein
MQPVRKVLNATHFKSVIDEGKKKWMPCSPGDSGAVEKSWTEVESDELKEPPLKMADFLKSLQAVRPTLNEADVRKFDDWTRDSGKQPYQANGPRQLSYYFSFFSIKETMVHDRLMFLPPFFLSEIPRVGTNVYQPSDMIFFHSIIIIQWV